LREQPVSQPVSGYFPGISREIIHMTVQFNPAAPVKQCNNKEDILGEEGSYYKLFLNILNFALKPQRKLCQANYSGEFFERNNMRAMANIIMFLFAPYISFKR